MDSWMLDDRTWEFSRCPFTGHVSLWPYAARAPHCVGSEGPETLGVGRIRPPVSLAQITVGRARKEHLRQVAVVGEVAAGRFDVTVAYRPPAEAHEELLVPATLVSNGVFALRVRGDSMRDLGIRDGDHVLVRPQADADNGDLVIAALADGIDPEGYVTLKRYYREAGHIRLQPANASMAPIHLYPEGERDPIVILGKVIALLRCDDDEA